MRRLLLASAAVLMLVMLVGRVAAADAVDDEARRIGKQLQCPVCSGAAVSDSPAELAGQMRSVIRAKVQAGESEQQIVAYFVERYGDSVLIEPPRHGFGLAVWIAPLGALAIGGFLLWRLLRSWQLPRRSPALVANDSVAAPYRNGTAHVEEPRPDAAVDRARAELDRFRREA